MRLYFDECCSRVLAREIREFFKIDHPDLVTEHVLDTYDPSTGDSDWLRPLKEDKTCIVITQDLGRDSKKEKLPRVCKEMGITHIAYSPIIINGGFSVHKAALIAVWPQILELHRLPRGTHVRLTRTDVKGGGFRYDLRVDGQLLSKVLASLT